MENTKSKRCVITIVAYKEHLENYEKLSLHRMYKVLAPKYDVLYVIPSTEGFDLTEYMDIAAQYGEVVSRITMDEDFFKNKFGYNILFTSLWFYYYFLNMGYEYMFVYQLDCYVFRNDLEDWMNLGLKQCECICTNWDGYAFFNGQGLRRIEDYCNFLNDKKCMDIKDSFVGNQIAQYVLHRNGYFKFTDFGGRFSFVDGEDNFFFKHMSDMKVPEVCWKFGWSCDFKERIEKYGIPTMIHYFQNTEYIKTLVGDWDNNFQECLEKEFG